MKTIEHKTTKQNRYKTLFQDFDNVINDSNINGNNNNEKEKKSVVNNSHNNIDNNNDESEVTKEKILYGSFFFCSGLWIIRVISRSSCSPDQISRTIVHNRIRKTELLLFHLLITNFGRVT